MQKKSPGSAAAFMKRILLHSVFCCLLLCMSTIFGGCSSPAPKGQKHFFETDAPTSRVWRLIGPGISGGMGDLAFHPRDPKTIYCGTDQGAAFKTINGGLTWDILGGASPSNRGVTTVIHPRSIAVAWNNPEIVWFANRRVYKSTAGGKAIVQVKDPPFEIWHNKKIYTDPSDDNIVYLHTDVVEQRKTKISDGALVRTVDGGETWETVVKWSTNDPHFWSSLVIDRYSEVVAGKGYQGLYLCGYNNLMWSTNGGATWTEIKGNLPECIVRDLLVIPGADKGRSLVANCLVKGKNQLEGYIYRSDDNGRSWVQKTAGITIMGSSYDYFNLANSPAAPNIIYYATGRECLVYRSMNLGETWEIVCNKIDMVIKPEINPTAFGGEKVDVSILGHYMSYHLPLAGGGNCWHNQYSWGGMSQFFLRVAPSDPNVVALSHATVIATTNGGKTWNDICSDLGEHLAQNRWPEGKVPTNTYLVASDGQSTLITNPAARFTPAPSDHTHLMRSRGVQVIVPRSAAFDPFDPQATIAVNYNDIGLRISRDGGNWWEWAYDPTCMVTEEMTSQGFVVYDPAVKGRIYTGAGRWGVPCDVFRSDDSGRTFQRLHVAPLWAKEKRIKAETGKLSGATVSRIVIDPSSPTNADRRILYAGVKGSFQKSSRLAGGIYKTENGGMTWREVSEGLGTNANIQELIIDERNPGRLYAGVYAGVGRKSGLFKTTNGGNSWRQIAPDKIGSIIAGGIALCREKPDTVYVLAFPAGTLRGPMKLWRSDNGGDDWKEVKVKINEKIVKITSVAASPVDPDWIYAVKMRDPTDAGDIGTILRSKNGGQNWEIIDDDKIPEANLGGDTWGLWGSMMQIDRTDPRRLIYYAQYGLWIGYDPEAPH